MSQAFRKFEQLKRKVHAWKAKDCQEEKILDGILDKNITTSEVKCQSCGFKARYKFVRCPECNEIQKS